MPLICKSFTDRTKHKNCVNAAHNICFNANFMQQLTTKVTLLFQHKESKIYCLAVKCRYLYQYYPDIAFCITFNNI